MEGRRKRVQWRTAGVYEEDMVNDPTSPQNCYWEGERCQRLKMKSRFGNSSTVDKSLVAP